MNPELVNWIGYAASALLMISFSLNDVKQLRIVNTLGCIASIIYGFLLPSCDGSIAINWPIVITNSFIVLMNLYHLFQAQKNN